jgi:PKD repeat protein
MSNLGPGEYVVYVSDNGVCGEIATTIVITEPEPIIADFDSDVDTVYTNSNTTIYFTNASINADDYHWDFGDGNTSDQPNPAHTYTNGGTYKVSLVGITGVCSDTLTKTIVVIDNVAVEEVISRHRDPINIYQYQNETYVELNFSEATDVVISLVDVLGRNTIEPVQLRNVTSRKIQLDVPSNIMGVYTVSVLTHKEQEAKKIYYTRK